MFIKFNQFHGLNNLKKKFKLKPIMARGKERDRAS